MKLFVLTIVFIFSFLGHATVMTHESYPASNKIFDEVLKTHVKYSTHNSTVNYAELKKQSQLKLKSYLHSLENLTQSQYNKMSKPQKMAFLINAYNAFTIKLIIDNYPIQGIKKIGGWFSSPWKKQFFKLLGKKRHLDWIEHDMLRPKFKDFRIHFALNCASIGCPRLRNEAYRGSRLDEQLNDQMKVFLTDRSRNYLRESKKEIHISKIFKWFEEDFKNIHKILSPYLSANGNAYKLWIKESWDIEYTDYDWSLNKH